MLLVLILGGLVHTALALTPALAGWSRGCLGLGLLASAAAFACEVTLLVPSLLAGEALFLEAPLLTFVPAAVAVGATAALLMIPEAAARQPVRAPARRPGSGRVGRRLR